MKLFGVLALLLLSSCASQQVPMHAPVSVQVVEEKAGSEATVLVMTERVFNYAPNSSDLTDADKKDLLKIIKQVSKNQDKYRRIEIIGHSDQTGTEDLNLDISKERAINVLEIMKQAGIDRKKIRTSWLAGTEPVEGKKESTVNRRVEIRFFELKK